MGVQGRTAGPALRPPRWAPLAVAGAAALTALLPAARADVPARPRTPGDVSPLPILGDVPDFHLRSLEGPAVRRATLLGKAVLVAFACVSCPDEPSRVEEVLVQLQQALKARGLFGRKVVLASIVRHPERESRAGFRAHAARLGVDPFGWVILSGSPETAARLRDAFGRLGASPADPGEQTRGRLYLVDYAGRVRGVYAAETLRPERILADLERLL